MMTDTKLTKDEFEKLFGHASKYGDPAGLPRQACLFYKFTNWQRSDHHCWHECFMEDAHFKPDVLRNCLHLYIILNKSPCRECSEHLIKMKCENKGLQISIKFSSFHNLHEPTRDESKAKLEEHLKNIKGLIEMIENGIKLHVFKGEDDWRQFLDLVLNVPQSEQEEWLACVRTKEKKEREAVDWAILQDVRNRAISVEDIMKMASCENEDGINEELARRNGKFVFDEGDCETQYLNDVDSCERYFKGEGPSANVRVGRSDYFFKVGSGSWSAGIKNEKSIPAERKMIDDIKKEDFQIIVGVCPCYHCCERLIDFKSTSLKCLRTVSMMFQSFTTEGNRADNIKGLIEAVENGINLERLDGDEKWKFFFDNFVKINDSDNGIGLEASANVECETNPTRLIESSKTDKPPEKLDGASKEYLKWRKEIKIKDPANGQYVLQDIINSANKNDYAPILHLLGVENPDLALEQGGQQRKRQGDTILPGTSKSQKKANLS